MFWANHRDPNIDFAGISLKRVMGLKDRRIKTFPGTIFSPFPLFLSFSFFFFLFFLVFCFFWLDRHHSVISWQPQGVAKDVTAHFWANWQVQFPSESVTSARSKSFSYKNRWPFADSPFLPPTLPFHTLPRELGGFWSLVTSRRWFDSAQRQGKSDRGSNPWSFSWAVRFCFV